MTPLAASFDAPGTVLLAAMVLVLLAPPLVPYEPLWEVAAGLGWAALAAAVVAFRIAPRGGSLTPYRYALHRTAGNLALLLVAGHVAVMVAGDPFLLDYLGWMMPRHVLAGVLATLAFVLAVTSREPALPRPLSVGGRSRAFHAWVGIAAGGLTGWHVLASSTKLLGSWRYGVLALLFLGLVAPALAGRFGRKRHRPPAGEPFSRAAAPGSLQVAALLLAFAALLAAVPHIVAELFRG
jgi:hypothetical protein